MSRGYRTKSLLGQWDFAGIILNIKEVMYNREVLVNIALAPQKKHHTFKDR